MWQQFLLNEELTNKRRSFCVSFHLQVRHKTNNENVQGWQLCVLLYATCVQETCMCLLTLDKSCPLSEKIQVLGLLTQSCQSLDAKQVFKFKSEIKLTHQHHQLKSNKQNILVGVCFSSTSGYHKHSVTGPVVMTEKTTK